VKAYVINLDSRSDRWVEVMVQKSILGLEIHRVPAVSVESVVVSPYVTKVIAATWQSHQKAMKIFLESSDEYALIMEDDFVLSTRWALDLLQLSPTLGADFLQIGFLITNSVDRIQITLNGIFDGFLKVLHKLSGFFVFIGNRMGKKLLIREQSGIPFKIVCNDIRPGAHAYIVSRKFAQAASQINSPEFLSADAVYMSMGWMRSFKLLRFRRSLVAQSNSESSITERFLNN
jgi:GR25 family glycosyltransferase involved in LPS biosynthesis